MATEYAFVDDSGTTRLEGFLVPNPGVTGAALSLINFPFTFATPGLNDGVTIYTPAVGDILYDAWIEVVTAFDGTFVGADIGQYNGATTGEGLWFFNSNIPDLTIVDTIDQGGGPANSPSHGSALGAIATQAGLQRLAPARFRTTDPLLLVSSQDGQKGGAAASGTVGSAIAWVLILRPT